MPPIVDVIQLIRQAGDRILEFYRRGDYSVSFKSDHSPVTEADMASHDLLTMGLVKLSGFPVLSEEAPIAYEERCQWERFWLVDPLDGTKDFIARNDEFTINVALIEGGAPVLGVLFAPALGELFFAEIGKGAYRAMPSGERERLPTYRDDKVTVLRSRFHDAPWTDEFIQSNHLNTCLKCGIGLEIWSIG